MNVSPITDWTRNEPDASISRMAFLKDNPAVFGPNPTGKIRTIIFQDHQTHKIGARLDISAYKSGRVSAYLSRDSATLYIGADGGINIGEHGYSLFSGLESLEEIIFENNSFHTDKSDDFSCMFKGCKSLRSLSLSGFRTSKVKSFEGMFSGCESLKELDLSGFDVTNSTGFSGMFSGCKSLAKLELGDFQIHRAVQWAKYFDERCDSVWFRVPPRISEMFSGCESLESLDLRSFSTRDVNHFTAMFENCRSLKTLQLSKYFVVRSDAKTDRMFAGCDSLDKAALPLALTPKQAEAAGLA